MSTRIHAIDLRQGGPADIAAVEAVMAAAFDPRFGEAWTRGQCLGVLAMPNVWLTLAELDGTVSGFALARLVVDEAELLLLAVAPPARRRGVGAALLRATLAAAQAREATSLFLEVRRGNVATELYLREGFSKIGERRGYYRGRDGQQHDAQTFRRTLA
jgi:[ribosomal protein S18]-alanine N-acetyltransferase